MLLTKDTQGKENRKVAFIIQPMFLNSIKDGQ